MAENNSSDADVKASQEQEGNSEGNSSQDMSLEEIQAEKQKALEELQNLRKARKAEQGKIDNSQSSSTQENPSQEGSQAPQSSGQNSEYDRVLQELKELKENFYSTVDQIQSQPVEEAYSSFLDEFPEVAKNEEFRKEFNSMYDRIKGDSLRKQDVYKDMKQAYYALKGPDIIEQEQQYQNTNSFIRSGSRGTGDMKASSSNVKITPKMQLIMEQNNMSEEHVKQLLEINPELGK